MRAMLYVSVVIVVAAVATALELQPTPKIVWGTIASIDEFPYFLQIEYNNTFRCGAAIYNEHTAVTSAHCVTNVLASNMVVRSGSDQRGSGGTTHQAVKVIPNPGYEGYPYCDYDIGLVIVDEPFNISNAIPLMSSQAPAGGNVTLAGMGQSSWNGDLTNLEYMNAKVITLDSCQKSYLYIVTLTNRMMCAKGTNPYPCSSDKGSPLVYDGQLAGVVSTYNDCSKAYLPKIYTDVAVLRSWIEEHAV